MNADDANKRLLQEYSQGSLEAFDLFYKKNHKFIFSFLNRILRNATDTEEAFQVTFLKIHKNIHRYKATESAMSWVLTIAHNVAIDLIRRRHSSQELDEGVLAIHDNDKDLSQTLEDYLNQLSAEDRALIQDKFLNEEDYSEIAKRLGLEQVNVRQKISRILKKLRSFEN